jgi:hypothetical protein
MTQRWGKDQEERSAVALKAQSAYSTARQAMEKITGLEATIAELREELTDERAARAATLLRLERGVAANSVALSKLEAQFNAATEAVPRPKPRRAIAA